MERQDTQEGLRVTLAEMEKVTWMQSPKSLNEQFLFCNLGSWAGQQKGRSAKQEGGKLCPYVFFPFVLVSLGPIFFLQNGTFAQEKRLVAQVNAVAVLDMIKDLQDEIKVTPIVLHSNK